MTIQKRKLKSIPETLVTAEIRTAADLMEFLSENTNSSTTIHLTGIGRATIFRHKGKPPKGYKGNNLFLELSK